MRWPALLLLTSVAASCGVAARVETLPFYRDADLTPTWLSRADAATAHAIAPFTLTDQHGQSIRQNDLDGRIYVASFIFTRCGGVCPVLVSNLKQVAAAFADDRDVVIVAHSVDPKADTPAVLARYARDHALRSDQWRLVTGEREAIYRLARESYFADDTVNPVAGSDFLHTEKVFLIDSERHIRGAYNGTLSLDMDRLIGDIRALKACG